MTEDKNTEDVRSESARQTEWDHKKDKYQEYGYYKSRRSMFFGLIGLVVLLVVIFGVIGTAMFGRYHNNRIGRVNNVALERNFDGNGMGRGMVERGHSFAGADQVTGKVTAVNGKTFTMNVGSNQTKDVQISDTTRFPISSNTSISVGDTVTVRGGQDSSGVIQATRISVD